MTTANRLDLTSGRLVYCETVDRNEQGAPVVEYRTLSVSHDIERWQAWLARGEPFQVEGTGPEGWTVAHFTARMERIKNKQSCFWYAYRRVGGKLRKLYLGRSADLTLDRLRAVAERIKENGGINE